MADAVASCHVERPLDDAVWSRFCDLQESRPGGFAVAALMRPADEAHGEDAQAWLARAREAAERAPLGHHTHWTAPDHAADAIHAMQERLSRITATRVDLGTQSIDYPGASVGVSESTSDLSSSFGDDKIVLAARDDAASFVASDGAIRGARLEAALRHIRERAPQLDADDRQLARAILVL